MLLIPPTNWRVCLRNNLSAANNSLRMDRRAGAKGPGDDFEIPAGKILVHNAQGPYHLDAAKWPLLKVDVVDEESAQLTLEEDLMDNNPMNLSTEDESSQGWISPAPKKKSRSTQRRG